MNYADCLSSIQFARQPVLGAIVGKSDNGEDAMPTSELSAVERIARVLAGQRLSANADGTESSASSAVELEWREHVEDALAVLRTLREPDQVMADAGNVETWRAMVEAAINDAEGDG